MKQSGAREQRCGQCGMRSTIRARQDRGGVERGLSVDALAASAGMQSAEDDPLESDKAVSLSDGSRNGGGGGDTKQEKEGTSRAKNVDHRGYMCNFYLPDYDKGLRLSQP